MVQKGDSSVQARISKSWSILKQIEEKGQDIGKLRDSLNKIEKVAKAAPEKELLRALSKFEVYLEKVSSQLGISADGAPTQNKPEGSDIQESGSVDDKPPSSSTSKKQKDSAHPDKKEGSRSIGKEDQVPQPTSNIEVEVLEKKDLSKDDSSHGKTEDVEIPDEMEEAPQAPSLKPDHIELKEDNAEVTDPSLEKVRLVEDLDREARMIGGDTSGIQPHLKAMKEAFQRKDMGMLDQYWKISYDWLSQYLVSLAPNAINNMIANIRAVESQYLDIGKQVRLDGKVPNITTIMKGVNSGDVEHLITSLKELRTSLELIEKDNQMLFSDLQKEMKDKTKEMKSLLSRVVDEEKRTAFSQKIERFPEGSENDTVTVYMNFRKLYQEVTGEAAIAEKRKFEMILQSVEPMIQRISYILGEASEDHIRMVREKDHLLSRFSSDIQGALEGMEKLLDDAAHTLADLEESRTQTLEKGINVLKEKLESLHQSMDAKPVEVILEKSEKALEDNDLEVAQELLTKAETTFKKIVTISIRKQAERSLNEVLSTRNELLGLSIDVSPLDEPLELATKALSNGKMEDFDAQMDILNERLNYMRRDELRVEYQKLMIMIMNEMKGLRQQGVDVDHFEKGLEEVKDLYLERKDKSSVERERSLLKELRKKKLSLVIGDRLDNAMATLKEAEGLLVDTEASKRIMDMAREKMRSGDVEESLDLMTRAQVELDERMTKRTFSIIEKEIRDLWSDSERYGLTLGDLEPEIQHSYNMADDGRFKDAMEHLYGMREKLSQEVKTARASIILEELGTFIKNARSVGLKVATFKAAHTKAKVLMDAGDVDSVIELVDKQILTLKDRIENRVELQSQLDELRGGLIGQEGKIKKLVDAGVPVEGLRESMARIRDLIEAADVEKARSEMSSLVKKISTLSTSGISGPGGMDPDPVPGDIAMDEIELDPEEAKTKLFSLIAEIRQEMKIRHTQGKATGEIKRDIETIQNLVIKKEYLKAYRIAATCLSRVTD